MSVRQQAAITDVIRDSGLFNAPYYQHCAALPPTGEDLLIRHYIDQGEAAGFAPNPLFQADFYLRQLGPRRRPACALADYIAQGHGRLNPGPLFDQAFYLGHPGIDIAPEQTPLAHYIRHGWRRGRDPHPLFSVSYYLKENADVRALGYDPLTHFMSNGWRERRLPCPDFDSAYYLDQNPDVVASGNNPLVHFLYNGARERRDPSANFDVGWYASLLQVDPAAAAQNPLVHYVQAGRAKGFLPRQRLFALDHLGRLSATEFDVWFDSLVALLNTLLAGRPRRRLVLVCEDAANPPRGIESVSSAELGDYLARRDRHGPEPLLLLFTQAGDRPLPLALSIMAAAFSDATRLMTCDAVCLEDDRAVPILLPGSNPIYLEHAAIVPPFCLSAEFCRSHKREPGETLAQWFRRLVAAGVASDTRAIRHLPLPAVVAPLARYRPAQPEVSPNIARIAAGICAPAIATAGEADVSIIICTKDCGQLLTQLVLTLLRPALPRVREIILVINQPGNRFARAYHQQLAQLPLVRIIDYAQDYNFSDQCNLAARQAQGAFLLFMNDDVAPIGACWLDRMLASIADPRVAVVGPLLLYPDETVQHAGMYLGFNNVAGHTLRRVRLPSNGADIDLVEAECSAVTGAVMLIRSSVFEALNGFDYHLATYLQDVDLCLRVSRMGLAIVFNPDAMLFHMESVSAAGMLRDPAVLDRRGREHQRFARRWGAAVFNDRYRNVNWFRQDEALGTLASVEPATLLAALDE